MVAERGDARSPKSGSGLVDSQWQRDRLEAALTVGVSLRRFNGWEPEQVHVHEYDDSGRLVRTVVTTEPEWDDEQRALVHELIDYKRNLCPKCHGHRSKAHDKNLQRDYEDVDDKCWDCDVIGSVYEARHAKHGKNECDCADRAIWVTGYRPLPPSRGTGLRSS